MPDFDAIALTILRQDVAYTENVIYSYLTGNSFLSEPLASEHVKKGGEQNAKRRWNRAKRSGSRDR